MRLLKNNCGHQLENTTGIATTLKQRVMYGILLCMDFGRPPLPLNSSNLVLKWLHFCNGSALLNYERLSINTTRLCLSKAGEGKDMVCVCVCVWVRRSVMRK